MCVCVVLIVEIFSMTWNNEDIAETMLKQSLLSVILINMMNLSFYRKVSVISYLGDSMKYCFA